MTNRKLWQKIAAVSAAGVLLLSAGCTKGSTGAGGDSNTIKLWTHNAGNEKELAAGQEIVDDFNASQDKWKVEVQAFPQDSYNQSVVSAASSKSLPCILDVDAPNVPNWAWAGYLAPIEGLDERLSEFLPSTVGRYNDKIYSYGHYDVALTMVARKSVLEAAGIRVATVEQPWNKDELMDALSKLKATGNYEYVLDMGTGGSGEWWPYAFSPFLQSFGGDLVNRDNYESAEGVLNGPEALAWGNWLQTLVNEGYMAKKSGTDSTLDFVNGKTALMWNGGWAAKDTREAFGDDVVFMPPPDMGKGPKIGGGSWQWALSSGCSNPEAAQEFMKFMAQDKYVVSLATATKTIPTTATAAQSVEGYATGGENEIFRQLSEKFTVVRPVTPGYPFMATEFEKMTQDIINGADVQTALNAAVKNIDANKKSNNYFK